MKFLLTSDGWKTNQKIKEVFLKMIGNPTNKKVLLITIARRCSKEWKNVRYHVKELIKIGIKKENIKIISLRDKEVNWYSKMDVIYICGGNTFHYMKELRRLKLTKKIKELVKRDVIYFGISAGSIIAGLRTDIAKIGKNSDKNDVGVRDFSGLGLVGFTIFPHYTNKDKKEIRRYERKTKSKVIRLKDGGFITI